MSRVYKPMTESTVCVKVQRQQQQKHDLISEFKRGGIKVEGRVMGNQVRKVGTVHLMPSLYVKRSGSYPKCFRNPSNDF